MLGVHDDPGDVSILDSILASGFQEYDVLLGSEPQDVTALKKAISSTNEVCTLQPLFVAISMQIYELDMFNCLVEALGNGPRPSLHNLRFEHACSPSPVKRYMELCIAVAVCAMYTMGCSLPSNFNQTILMLCRPGTTRSTCQLRLWHNQEQPELSIGGRPVARSSLSRARLSRACLASASCFLTKMPRSAELQDSANPCLVNARSF